METEIKLELDDPASGKRQLTKLGFSIAKRRVLEINTILDTPDSELLGGRKLLRLRQAGSRHTLTFKGPPVAGRYKSREEIESTFTDDEAMRLILAGLGYEPVFRYEKYRTEFSRRGHAGMVMLDETPIAFPYFYNHMSASKPTVVGAEFTGMGHIRLTKAGLKA